MLSVLSLHFAEYVPATGNVVSNGCVSTVCALTQHSTLCIEAQGAAVHKAVTVAEIVKRRRSGLQQTTNILLATDQQGGTVPAIAICLALDRAFQKGRTCNEGICAMLI